MTGKDQGHDKHQNTHEQEFSVAQGVKDPVLTLLWIGSPLWCGLDPWTWSPHVLWVWLKKKKPTRNQIRACLRVCERAWGQKLLHVSFRFQCSSWGPSGKSPKLFEIS